MDCHFFFTEICVIVLIGLLLLAMLWYAISDIIIKIFPDYCRIMIKKKDEKIQALENEKNRYIRQFGEITEDS